MNNAIGSGLFMSRQVRWYGDKNAAVIIVALQLPASAPALDRRSRSDDYAEAPSVLTKQRPIHLSDIFFEAARKLVGPHTDAPAAQARPGGWLCVQRHYGMDLGGEMTAMLQNQVRERRDHHRRRSRLRSRTHWGGPPGRSAPLNATIALGMGVNPHMAGAIRIGIA